MSHFKTYLNKAELMPLTPALGRQSGLQSSISRTTEDTEKLSLKKKKGKVGR